MGGKGEEVRRKSKEENDEDRCEATIALPAPAGEEGGDEQGKEDERKTGKEDDTVDSQARLPKELIGDEGTIGRGPGFQGRKLREGWFLPEEEVVKPVAERGLGLQSQILGVPESNTANDMHRFVSRRRLDGGGIDGQKEEEEKEENHGRALPGGVVCAVGR